MSWFTRLLHRRPHGAAATEPDWNALEAELPLLDRLESEARLRLRRLALDFLARKAISGAQGMVVDDRIRLLIALQACLLILELGLEAYDGWAEVIVYPGDFVIPRRWVDEDGVLHEYEEPALGEAWENGPVILAWFDDRREYGGCDVVIHEFAHTLDMLNGAADGMPPLHAGMSRARWEQDFGAAFDDLNERIERGQETEIDPYAAEDPAEFFAVCSEVFFASPALLKNSYPAVFDHLVAFYRQQPLSQK